MQERLISAIEGLSQLKRAELSAMLERVVRAAGIADGPAPLFFEEETR